MLVAGTVLSVIGGVIVMAGILALNFMKEDGADEGEPISTALDVFLCGGLFTFLDDFFRAVSKGLKERSSPEFPLVILMASGIALVAIGAGLLWFGGG